MTDELTPRQVAEALGVTPRTVQRWIATGRLAATRVGGRQRVSRSSLTAVAKQFQLFHPIGGVSAMRLPTLMRSGLLTVPLSLVAISVTTAGSRPSVRSTLVAPMLPLPWRWMSVTPKARATSHPIGTAPIR